jgi:exodeoxyribonuclease V alpha subunit
LLNLDVRPSALRTDPAFSLEGDQSSRGNVKIQAYANTIHKSQGSEYSVIIIPLMIQHFPMLKRNLLYTGITRGKKLVVIIGEKKALAIAVKDRQTRKRYTKLRDWLL